MHLWDAAFDKVLRMPASLGGNVCSTTWWEIHFVSWHSLNFYFLEGIFTVPEDGPFCREPGKQ